MTDQPPALYRQCLEVWEAMAAKATDTEDGKIWEGFLTKLITKELRFPTPYFTKIRDMLIRMDCIRQLQRGGGSSPSRWLLLQMPSEPLFEYAQGRRTTRNATTAMLQQQLNDMNRRVLELENWRAQQSA